MSKRKTGIFALAHAVCRYTTLPGKAGALYVQVEDVRTATVLNRNYVVVKGQARIHARDVYACFCRLRGHGDVRMRQVVIRIAHEDEGLYLVGVGAIPGVERMDAIKQGIEIHGILPIVPHIQQQAFKAFNGVAAGEDGVAVGRKGIAGRCSAQAQNVAQVSQVVACCVM